MTSFPSRDAQELITDDRTVWVFRHPVIIRICHWINATCIFVLLMSGLQIFNAHPSLYWGPASDFDHPILSIEASQQDQTPRGQVSVFGHTFDTTGVLGLSTNAGGYSTERAFPTWATIPGTQDLATGRRWHFLFAWLFVLNGFIYLVYGIISRQLAFRLIPSRDQIAHAGRTIWEHMTLNFPKGTEAKRYNLLQKVTYFVLIVLLLPLQVLTGLTMSPAMNTAFPFLLSLFGGRQSARSIHFLIMDLIVAFIVVHLLMVIVSGLWNNMRSMLSGWYVIDRPSANAESHDETH